MDQETGEHPGAAQTALASALTQQWGLVENNFTYSYSSVVGHANLRSSREFTQSIQLQESQLKRQVRGQSYLKHW